MVTWGGFQIVLLLRETVSLLHTSWAGLKVHTRCVHIYVRHAGTN